MINEEYVFALMRIQTNSLIDQYSLGRTQRSSHRYSGECMLIIICCAALDVWEIPAHPYFICSLGLHHCAFIIDHLEFFIIFSFSFVYITVIAIFFFFFFFVFQSPYCNRDNNIFVWQPSLLLFP